MYLSVVISLTGHGPGVLLLSTAIAQDCRAILPIPPATPDWLINWIASVSAPEASGPLGGSSRVANGNRYHYLSGVCNVMYCQRLATSGHGTAPVQC